MDAWCRRTRCPATDPSHVLMRSAAYDVIAAITHRCRISVNVRQRSRKSLLGCPQQGWRAPVCSAPAIPIRSMPGSTAGVPRGWTVSSQGTRAHARFVPLGARPVTRPRQRCSIASNAPGAPAGRIRPARPGRAAAAPVHGDTPVRRPASTPSWSGSPSSGTGPRQSSPSGS